MDGMGRFDRKINALKWRRHSKKPAAFTMQCSSDARTSICLRAPQASPILHPGLGGPRRFIAACYRFRSAFAAGFRMVGPAGAMAARSLAPIPARAL
jgi:hypothetical protein